MRGYDVDKGPGSRRATERRGIGTAESLGDWGLVDDQDGRFAVLAEQRAMDVAAAARAVVIAAGTASAGQTRGCMQTQGAIAVRAPPEDADTQPALRAVTIHW